MKRHLRPNSRLTAAQLLLGGVGLVLATFLCFQLKLNVGTTGFAYLILIVLLSLMGSLLGSIVLSILAVLCLQYFFAPPLFSFRVDYPDDISAIAAFLTASVIITGLTAKAGKLAAEARASQKALVDTIPALVWSTLPDGSLDFINQRWDEHGLSLEDLQGSEWQRVIHPDERAGVVDKWRTAVATGTPYENIERVRRADGVYRWVLSRAAPLRDDSGKIIKWYGTDTDIEDRKRAEAALRESEQRFRDYAETASDWLWETGPDHRFLRVSEHLDRRGVAPRLELAKHAGLTQRTSNRSRRNGGFIGQRSMHASRFAISCSAPPAATVLRFTSNRAGSRSSPRTENSSAIAASAPMSQRRSAQTRLNRRCARHG
jgi:PAS domain S-box-containing protein